MIKRGVLLRALLFFVYRDYIDALRDPSRSPRRPTTAHGATSNLSLPINHPNHKDKKKDSLNGYPFYYYYTFR